MDGRRLFRQEIAEIGTPENPPQEPSRLGQLHNAGLVFVSLALQAQSHESSGNDIHFCFEGIADSLEQRQAQWPLAGRLRPQVSRDALLVGLLQHGLRVTALVDRILEPLLYIPQVPAAQPDAPDHLPHAGKGLGVTGSGQKQHRAARRCVLESSGQIEQRADPDGFVGSGCHPRHQCARVVKCLHDDQLIFELRVRSGNHTVDVLGRGLFPFDSGSQTGRPGNQALRRRFEVAENPAGRIEVHTQSRK